VGDLRKNYQTVLTTTFKTEGIQINDGIKAMMWPRFFKTGSVDEWMDCGNKKCNRGN
jgi:glucose-1-phosphate thymidylyltransferase